VAAPNWDMPVASVLFGNGDGSLLEKTFLRGGLERLPRRVRRPGRRRKAGSPDHQRVRDHDQLPLERRPHVPERNLSRGLVAVLGRRRSERRRKSDLVLLGSSYLGNGDGTFGPAITYVADMGTPSPLVLADLNGDSKLDLVLTSYQRPVLSVYLGNGDGSFAPPIVYKTGSVAGSIAVADLNHDGRPDIAAVNPGSNTVSVFMNHGDGSLVARVDYPSGGLGPYIVRVGDMDGDGTPDLVVYNFSSGTTSIVTGRGDGSFGSPQTYVTPGAVDLVLADLNSDGRPICDGEHVQLHRLRASESGHRAAVLPVRLTLEPGTLNPRSNGPWVTAFIEPVGFSASDIVASSLRLATTLTADPKFAKIVDHDGNGIPELAVRFSRQALGALVVSARRPSSSPGRWSRAGPCRAARGFAF